MCANTLKQTADCSRYYTVSKHTAYVAAAISGGTRCRGSDSMSAEQSDTHTHTDDVRLYADTHSILLLYILYI